MSNLQLEIQKRHTLNWLIQGAAQHAGMTFHHLVRDELNALEPRLLQLYDQYALVNLLQYWHLAGLVAFGSPQEFWHRAETDPQHPYYQHPLLAKYGGMMAEAGRQRGLERSLEKGLSHRPIVFQVQAVRLTQALRHLEPPHHRRLQELAKEVTAMVWGIPGRQLEAELSAKIRLEPGVLPTRNAQGAAFRACIVGYGMVVNREDNLKVVGKGTNWQLLCKELVKGTAELICLHGLNQLDEETYHEVLAVTDHLDLEPSMLQSGGELWRRLLLAFPEGQPLANTLMNLARLPAGRLETLVAEMLDHPDLAKCQVAKLN
jgi:hypothetical protein